MLVSLDRIRRNLTYIKQQSGVRLLFMVKADGYGHGAVPCALACEDTADMFGTATVDEGIRLRRAGVRKAILAAAVREHELTAAASYGLTVAVTSCTLMRETAKLAASGVRIPVHIKLDTGMHRLGIEKDELDCVLSQARAAGVAVTGVYSHLRAPNTAQLKEFRELSEKVIEHYPNAVRHLASSCAYSKPEYRYDMVRIGLFGYRGAMSVYSEVVSLRDVRRGEHIGYGDYISDRDRRIALVFGGYADGICREHPSSVLIRGRECPVVGRVCMDMFAVDTADMRVVPGECVTILGGALTAERVAKMRKSVEYTVMTSFNGRTERIYFDDKGAGESGSII